MNSVKKVVLSGITRSGTNLLSSLMAAQAGVLSSNLGLFEFPYAEKYLINKKPDFAGFADETFNAAIRTLVPTSGSIADGYHTNLEIYSGVSIVDWLSYYRKLYEISAIDQFDAIYNDFAEKHGYRVMATRVTSAIGYAETFLDRGRDYYWIEIIRNPLARYYSAKRAHSLLVEDSISQSVSRIEKVKKIKSERLLVVSYEEMVNDPAKVVADMCSFIGMESEQFVSVPLGPDGQVFYGNSSDNKSIFYQDKSREPVYGTSLKAYQGKLSRYERAVAAWYGYGDQDISILVVAAYVMPIRLLLSVTRVLELGCVGISLVFKYVSITFGLLPYLPRKGYRYISAAKRVFLNQRAKYLRFFY